MRCSKINHTVLDNFQNSLKSGQRGHKDEISISELKADWSQRDESPYQRSGNHYRKMEKSTFHKT